MDLHHTAFNPTARHYRSLIIRLAFNTFGERCRDKMIDIHICSHRPNKYLHRTNVGNVFSFARRTSTRLRTNDFDFDEQCQIHVEYEHIQRMNTSL